MDWTDTKGWVFLPLLRWALGIWGHAEELLGGRYGAVAFPLLVLGGLAAQLTHDIRWWVPGAVLCLPATLMMLPVLFVPGAALEWLFDRTRRALRQNEVFTAKQVIFIVIIAGLVVGFLSHAVLR